MTYFEKKKLISEKKHFFNFQTQNQFVGKFNILRYSFHIQHCLTPTVVLKKTVKSREAWTWAFSMDMNTHHSHGHAPLTIIVGTCNTPSTPRTVVHYMHPHGIEYFQDESSVLQCGPDKLTPLNILI
jgi:hypothetical protein